MSIFTESFLNVDGKWKQIKSEGTVEVETDMPMNDWTKFFDDIIEDDMFLEFLTREEIAEDMEDEVPCYGIKAIRAQGPAVITFWDDGSRTVSKYNVNEETHRYNVLVPILLNVLKKALHDRAGLYALLDAIDETDFNMYAEGAFDAWRINNLLDYDCIDDRAVELRATEDGFRVCRTSQYILVWLCIEMNKNDTQQLNFDTQPLKNDT